MADYKSNPGSNYNKASPGVVGAVKDAINAVADYAAPDTNNVRKIKAQEAQIEGQHDDDTLARMRRGQSTDMDNKYQ